MLSVMGTEVDRNDGHLPNSAEDDLRKLEEDYASLRDETQQLINERTTLEAEMRTLRKRIERLDENVNLLKMPPLIVGHIQDVLDHERAIVRSSNGTVFQVSLNQRLDPESSNQARGLHSIKTAFPWWNYSTKHGIRWSVGQKW